MKFTETLKITSSERVALKIHLALKAANIHSLVYELEDLSIDGEQQYCVAVSKDDLDMLKALKPVFKFVAFR